MTCLYNYLELASPPLIWGSCGALCCAGTTAGATTALGLGPAPGWLWGTVRGGINGSIQTVIENLYNTRADNPEGGINTSMCCSALIATGANYAFSWLTGHIVMEAVGFNLSIPTALKVCAVSSAIDCGTGIVALSCAKICISSILSSGIAARWPLPAPRPPNVV
jgi:hypothetical protein